MKIKIQSDEYISDTVVETIQDIFRHSNCPNESLRNSFEKFFSFDGKTIQFGESEKFVKYIEDCEQEKINE